MKKMLPPVVRQPISFLDTVDVSDEASGTLPGEETVVYTCLAKVRPLKASKLLEANQETMRQAYQFEFWVDPDFEPKLNQTILFFDERLTNQGFAYTDSTRREYVLTALEGIVGS